MSTFLVGGGLGVGAALLWILQIKRDVVAFFLKKDTLLLLLILFSVSAIICIILFYLILT